MVGISKLFFSVRSQKINILGFASRHLAQLLNPVIAIWKQPQTICKRTNGHGYDLVNYIYKYRQQATVCQPLFYEIYLFCVPGTVLCTGDTETKRRFYSSSLGVCLLVGEMVNSKDEYNLVCPGPWQGQVYWGQQEGEMEERKYLVRFIGSVIFSQVARWGNRKRAFQIEGIARAKA